MEQQKTYIVSFNSTGEEYVFGDERFAGFFQACRSVYPMIMGSQPNDGGNLFLTPEERAEVLSREPGLGKFIRRVYGSKEFIQNIERYCFWLVDATPADIKHSKILYERVSRVKEHRLASRAEATRKKSDNPALFSCIRQPSEEYMLIPRHSSECRKYIPMGYVSPDIIATDAVIILPKATPYHFGVLTSSAHMAWMRVICGRLKSDYRYSNTVVYNNFVWPKADPNMVMKIFRTGSEILRAREKHPESSFADLYDEVSMPKDLRDAHRENDRAVLEAYGLPADMDEFHIVEHLVKLNYAMTGREYPE
ncbi:MAG: hypothetical protein IJT02_07440 [Synergistaceae bacterium]|nr:hypothetical protein [Synergistaceae bacterium]